VDSGDYSLKRPPEMGEHGEAVVLLKGGRKKIRGKIANFVRDRQLVAQKVTCWAIKEKRREGKRGRKMGGSSFLRKESLGALSGCKTAASRGRASPEGKMVRRTYLEKKHDPGGEGPSLREGGSL